MTRRWRKMDSNPRSPSTVSSVHSGACDATHAPGARHQRGLPVDHHCLGVRNPRLIVDRDRHARGGQRLYSAPAAAWRAPIGDKPDIDAPLLGTDQRPNNAGADAVLQSFVNARSVRLGCTGRRTTVLYRNNPIMVVRNETVAGYMFWLATMAFVFGIIIGIVG
jgi:hypothetical protein